VLPAIHPIGDGVQQVACHRAEELDLKSINAATNDPSGGTVDDTTPEQVADSDLQEAVEIEAGAAESSAEVTP
jgi:hypothetical protein